MGAVASLDDIVDRVLGSHRVSGGRSLVLVGGCSRVGKSTLARRLRDRVAAAGVPCVVLPADHWIVDARQRAAASSVVDRFEMGALEAAVGRLIAGDAVHPPVYDARTRQRLAERGAEALRLEQGVLIVDGVVALLSARLLADAAIRIHVDARDDVRRHRLREFYVRDKGLDTSAADVLIEAREREEVPTVQRGSVAADVRYFSHVHSATITQCRVCDGATLSTILDLGAQPPANSLRANKSERLDTFPLIICRCGDCGTIQLTETIDPSILFEHYVWVTGTSEVARAYSRVFRERLRSRGSPGRWFVVEVASNDGTFLRPFLEAGDRVLGVDPARNIASMAEAAGIPTKAEFFGLESAQGVVAEQGHADAVFARNVIPHVANATDVVAGMAHCLKPDGVGAIEFHRADTILQELHYDSIYHEHLFYHSLDSLTRLLQRFALLPFDVAESPISGGSLVVYFSRRRRPAAPALAEMIAREETLGIATEGPWREFARRCERHKQLLRDVVESKRRQGKRIIGYGASARSSTLLNYCGIDHRALESIADRATLKQGLYTPGTDILIEAPDAAFARKPDVVLLLGWNFRDEILGQIRREQRWRGEVIVPLPGDPTVLDFA